MGKRDVEFRTRLDEWTDDLATALRGLYGDESDTVFDRLVDRAAESSRARSRALVALDRRRVATPDWFQQRERVGYMAYVDRFGGDLAGVRTRIPYLTELGVDVLHLLSLFAPRVGENDGGYAVREYLVPDPAIGTPGDLDDLVADLHGADISLCADFVLNHTSDDHDWAAQARAGSRYHQNLFIMFDDAADAERYEATLPEVFPQMAPGNFTYDDEIGRWVWTTFREFQWDLNWANPDVMVEIAQVALELANLGVDMLRLDAIAFTWKRLGTNCQNQAEAHLIAQALRAVLAIAAPATVLLAEAIVGPDDLVGYVGRHRLERRECQIAYHNQLMVQGWSMLATGEAALARTALSRLTEPPTSTTWFTYVRCHDDIGWAVDDPDAAAVGASGSEHRAFLAQFYRGDFPMSFATGVPFATNDATGDERTCGMTSSLTGVAAAKEAGDAVALDLAIRRALLLYGLAFGYGGIPIIYMGDEVCLADDVSYRDDPVRAADSRWLHRPALDDAHVARRSSPDTEAGRLWAGIRHLVETRRALRPLHGAAQTQPFDTGASNVFGWHRHHERFGDLVGLANLTPGIARADSRAIAARVGAADAGRFVDRLDVGAQDVLALDAYQVRWLAVADDYEIVPAPPG
ncbi:MAG: alpha-amylase [Ilumatobacter sp.]|nr:alpha-amylase [Ilumatobacter sp.]